MKSAIVCYNCKKLKKYSESYSLKVEEFVSTKEVALEFAGLTITDNGFVSKVRICRSCSKKMGYKTKKVNKAPKSGTNPLSN